MSVKKMIFGGVGFDFRDVNNRKEFMGFQPAF